VRVCRSTAEAHSISNADTKERRVTSPDDLRPVANFLFEVGMLKRTPRSGLQFLGSGNDSVAEHILRATYLGFTLGRLVPGADRDKLVLLCLLHDFAEARTGDLNYENKKYVKADEDAALRDAAAPLPFGADMIALVAEFERQTLEARLAHDRPTRAVVAEGRVGSRNPQA
jgi:putative hydrolase of HD superfamily